jgi:hypothetical protein
MHVSRLSAVSTFAVRRHHVRSWGKSGLLAETADPSMMDPKRKGADIGAGFFGTTPLRSARMM